MINTENIEKALIGCILIDELILEEIELNPFHFLDPVANFLFTSILELKKEKWKVDLLLFKEKIKWNRYKISDLDLLEIVENTVNSINFSLYQNDIKENYKKQNLKNILVKNQLEINNWLNIDSIIWNIYNQLSWLDIENKEKTLYDLLAETEDYIDEIKSKELIWFSFWKEFNKLDLLTWWIQKWKVYRIWWGSNVGKTWLLYNFLCNLLKSWNKKISFFSLENSEKFTLKNILCHLKWVNPRDDLIKKNNYDFWMQYKILMNMEWFNIFTKYRDLNSIFRIALKNKSEFIFIDYLQLIDFPNELKSDLEKFTYYWKEIQKFANKYNIWVIDLSQLSNSVQKWGASGEWNSEFKGGWTLKETCDVWISLFTNKQKSDNKEIAIWNWEVDKFNINYIDLLISKNRLWPWAGTILSFLVDFNKWWVFEKDF